MTRPVNASDHGVLPTGDTEWVTLRDLAAELRAGVAASGGDVTALQAEIDAVEVDVATAQADIAAVEADVATLQTDTSTAQADIDAAEARLTTAESDIAALQSDVAAIPDIPWSLAQKPATPSAADEEFEGTAFSGWTQHGTPSATAINFFDTTFTTANNWRHSWNSMRPSWLMVQPAADGNIQNIISKAYTFPTNVLIWTRVCWPRKAIASASLANNDFTVGIQLSATSGGAPDANNRVLLFFDCDAGDIALQGTRIEGGVTTDAFEILWSDIGGSPPASVGLYSQTVEYLGIWKVGSTIHYLCATASGAWLPLGSQSYAGTAFDRIGLIAGNASTSYPGVAILGWEFVREHASGTQPP